MALIACNFINKLVGYGDHVFVLPIASDLPQSDAILQRFPSVCDITKLLCLKSCGLISSHLSLGSNGTHLLAYRPSPLSAGASGTIFRNLLKSLRFPLAASALR